jgi:hypothetical protein
MIMTGIILQQTKEHYTGKSLIQQLLNAKQKIVFGWIFPVCW